MLNSKLNQSHFDDLDADLYDFSDYDYLTSKIIDKEYDFDSTTYDNDTSELCYITSNEHLDSYMRHMKLKDSTVATVGSSGDQALNALYYGSKDVTLIDGNPYTRAFVEYKIAMIKNFSYREFWNILYNQNTSRLFSWKTYSKISHDLSQPVRNFWDRIMLEQSAGKDSIYNPDQLVPAYIYYRICHDYAEKSSTFYKNSFAYKKLQNILLKGDYNLTFINSDVFDFDNKLDDKYDNILLSNIMTYCNYNKYSKFLSRLSDLKLNPNGEIQYNYKYGIANHKLFCLETSPRKNKVKIRYCNGDYAYFLTKKQNSKEKEMSR